MRKFTCGILDDSFDMGGTPINPRTIAALAASDGISRRVWGLLAEISGYSVVRLNSYPIFLHFYVVSLWKFRISPHKSA